MPANVHLIRQEGTPGHGPNEECHGEDIGLCVERYGYPTHLHAYSRRRKFMIRNTPEQPRRLEMFISAPYPQHVMRRWWLDNCTAADELLPVVIDPETGELGGLQTDTYKMATTLPPVHEHLGPRLYCGELGCCNAYVPLRMVVPLLRIIDQVGQTVRIRLSGDIPRAGAFTFGGSHTSDLALRFGAVDVYSDARLIRESFWGHHPEEGICELWPIPEEAREIDIPVFWCDQVIDMWEWSPADDTPDCNDAYQYAWWQGQPWHQRGSRHIGYELQVEAWLLPEGGALTGAPSMLPKRQLPKPASVIGLEDVPPGMTTEQLRDWFWRNSARFVRRIDGSRAQVPAIADPLRIAEPGEPARFPPGRPSRGCGPKRTNGQATIPVPAECYDCPEFVTLDYGIPACRLLLREGTLLPCPPIWAKAVRGQALLPDAEKCMLRRKREERERQ